MIIESPFRFYPSVSNELSPDYIITNGLKLVLLDDSAGIVTANTVYSNLTNELSTGGGYVSGGFTVTGLTFTSNKLTFSPILFTTTASVTFKYFAIYINDTSKTLLGYGYANFNSNSPLNVTLDTGDNYYFNLTSNGLFQVTLTNSN